MPFHRRLLLLPSIGHGGRLLRKSRSLRRSLETRRRRGSDWSGAKNAPSVGGNLGDYGCRRVLDGASSTRRRLGNRNPIASRSFGTKSNVANVIDSVHDNRINDSDYVDVADIEPSEDGVDQDDPMQLDGSKTRPGDGDDENLLERYESLVQAGDVTRDPHQIRALKELDRLREELMSNGAKEINQPNEGERSDGEDAWSMTGLFSLTPSWANPSTDDAGAPETPVSQYKGVYLHGGVGCGKTYCMDLFYESLPPAIGMGKQKVHFHKFMLNMHKRMHRAKTERNLQGDDVIDYVIRSTLSRGRVLCFDEFQVTDVADALVLRRLFTGLLARGTVVVATSNRPPRDLYKGGLQRDLFLPFIDLLEESCAVVGMWESETDYRLAQGGGDREDGGAKGVYFVNGDPDDGKAGESFESLFRAVTRGSPIRSLVLDVQGREVFVPKASERYGVARFSFYDLCGTAKGASDYLAIGERFHTVFVEDVPRLRRHEVNLVRRWITLIDALYECRVRLVVHAATDPEGMFQVDLENDHCDEAFAFDRTRSRMEEMRSEGYLRKKWVGSQL